tara:strand:+ start:1555 stop:2631 length:1077 start_codon:yes stop_codon:yes gene_type:complete
MSQLRVNSIRHTGALSDAIELATDGTCTAKITNNLSNRRININGAMNIAQRAVSVTGCTLSAYRTCDRQQLGLNNLGTWTVTQESNGPDGFSNSFKALCTTADGSPNASDSAVYFHHIEAQDLQQLAYGTSNAKAMVLSFWVKSNKTGNATLELQQYDNSDKRVTPQYSISSANTWEKKTISITGDTSGVINNDNGTGLRLGWWLNSGSTYTGGSHRSTWTANDNTDRNVSNLGVGGAVNDYFQITGVQLEIDSTGSGVATDFEHRSYGDELARCQRYYGTGGNSNGTTTYPSSDGYARGWHDFKVQMRATPTMTFSDRSTGGSKIGDNINNGGFFVTYGSLGASQAGTYDWTASSEL